MCSSELPAFPYGAVYFRKSNPPAEDWARDYRVAAKIIRMLGIRSVRLITNNPDKIGQLEAAGVPVVDRIPVVIPANPFDREYIEVKRQKMGHMI